MKDEFKDIDFTSEELEREYIGVTFDHCDFTGIVFDDVLFSGLCLVRLSLPYPSFLCF